MNCSLSRFLALALLCFLPLAGVRAQTNLQSSSQTTLGFTPAPALTWTPDQSANLGSQLAAAQAALTASQTQLSQSQAQYQQEQAQYTLTQSQLASTLALLNASQPQIAAVQAQLTSAQSALATAQSGQQAAQAQVATLQAQLQTLTSSAASLTAQVASLQAAATVQSQQISSYQSQIAGLQATAASQNAQISTLTGEVASLTAQVVAGSSGTAAAVRQVIAHDLPDASPPYDTTAYYGSNQPLLIVGSAGVDAAAFYQQAIDAGIDILAVDGFLDPSQTLSRLPIGDSIHLGFEPCLDTDFEGTKSHAQVVADVVAFCEAYVAGAAGHASAVQVGGKYQISTYNDSARLSGSDWASVKAQLAAANVPVTFLGDVGGQYLTQGQDGARQQAFAGFAAPFDALYCFGPATTTDGLDSLLEGFVASGKAWAGTIRPAYLKVTGTAASGNTISYEDAQGTQTLQQRWTAADTLALLSYPTYDRTTFVSTWSDFSENSGLMPSTDWNTTLSDVNAWYAAQFKGTALPWTNVRLYLTVQQAAYLGGNVRVEALVLNGSASRVYVKSVIQNLNAQAITGQFGGPVAPYSAATFTCPNLVVTSALLSQTAISGVHALKDYTTVTNDVSGQQILGMESARALLYNAAAPSGGGQALYYSIPSTHFAGYAQPHGTLNISPSGVKTLTITPASGYTVRSVELLHDTRRAFISYGTGAVSNLVFTDLNRGADNRNDSADHGCYIIREVTTDNHETYSDPLAVTHH